MPSSKKESWKRPPEVVRSSGRAAGPMAVDDELIATGLRELGALDVARVRGWARLARAASGSSVYRLALDDGEGMVLKVSPGHLSEGANRELHFYREVGDGLPLRTPCLIAGATTRNLTCILLSAADQSPPARDWTDRRWVQAARQLGRLHHPEVVSRIGRHSWLSRRPRPTSAQASERDRARRLWRELGRYEVARPLLEDLGQLAGALEAVPACLLHGDCHAGNLLVDPVDGELVWTDWQEVGLGHGPEDLALLWQRGEFDGGTPPRREMLAAYAAARGTPDDHTLRRAAIGAEIRLALLSWPPFLSGAAPSRREIIYRRLAALAREWAAG